MKGSAMHSSRTGRVRSGGPAPALLLTSYTASGQKHRPVLSCHEQASLAASHPLLFTWD